MTKQFHSRVYIQKPKCTLMFIAALFTIAKIWKSSKFPSTDEWIKKMWYIYVHTHIYTGGFPGGSVVKNLPANTGDVGLIPGLGRSPGRGHNNPLQYSCLKNPKDRVA